MVSDSFIVLPSTTKHGTVLLPVRSISSASNPDVLQFHLIQHLEIPERVQYCLRKTARFVVVQFHWSFGNADTAAPA